MKSILQVQSFKEGGEHSYHRRAFNHDYYSPFIYHIILKKRKDCPKFGNVKGNAGIAPGLPGCAYIAESALGSTIAKTLLHLPYRFPILKLLHFKVMPDHLHFILQVLYRSSFHLDYYIYQLVEDIAKRYSKQQNQPVEAEDIFQPGYCDKPLYDDRSLDGWYVYLDENPHRLAMRIQYPEFFQRVRSLKIGNREYEAYGNLFLFRNPDKTAVKIGRSYSLEEKNNYIAGWLSEAAGSSVLVSPFISKEEKAVREEAEKLDGSIILITHEVLPEGFKPAKHDFDLCSRGKLMIISLGLPPKTPLSREICMRMNALAAEVSSLS